MHINPFISPQNLPLTFNKTLTIFLILPIHRAETVQSNTLLYRNFKMVTVQES